MRPIEAYVQSDALYVQYNMITCRCIPGTNPKIDYATFLFCLQLEILI